MTHAQARSSYLFEGLASLELTLLLLLVESCDEALQHLLNGGNAVVKLGRLSQTDSISGHDTPDSCAWSSTMERLIGKHFVFEVELRTS
jgi:hypothetical protein